MTVSVVNSWANSYGQGLTFSSNVSLLQSCIVPLTSGFSVGGGSGTPTAGNWLFTIASWTIVPALGHTHVGVGDDIHSWWRQFFPSSGAGWSYTASGTPSDGTYFTVTTAQSASITAGDEFHDGNNPGILFRVSNIGTPSGGFVNVSFAPTAATIMSSPDVVTQNFPGNVRTSISYTPNTARQVGNVYVAPDNLLSAINVLVVEVSGLGPWDTVVGPAINYAAAATSLPLSLGAPGAASFFIGAAGGDNIAATQAFAPAGYTTLHTLSQTDGSDHLADNYLTSAYIASSSSSQSVSATAGTATDLSGMLLGVYTTGLNPIPAGGNPNWPHVVFEAAFGSGFNNAPSELNWVDLTSRLWSFEETTGIQFQLGALQATNLSLTLDNNDNYLASQNTSSPYYPNVVAGTPLRLRAALGTIAGVTYNRWYVIQRNAQEFPEQIDEAFRRFAPVTGTDVWAVLSSTGPTPYRGEVLVQTSRTPGGRAMIHCWLPGLSR